MYTEQQAKSGFKTFVVTLSVSLLLFGALYYLITGFSQEIDIEDSSATFDGGKTTVVYNAADASEEVMGATTQSSVFGEIAEAPVDAQPATVLAAGDVAETTESTVPATGSNTLLGITMAVASFSAAAYVLLIGPRKLALSGFERDVTE